MADKLSNDDTQGSPTSGGENSGSMPDKGRRRITQLGLSAPLVMTLASRPVWGGTNCTESGMMSGNMSDINAFGECGGEGCMPVDWANNPDKWGVHHGPDRFFSDVFSTDAFPGRTLLEVINGVSPGQTNPPAGCSPAGLCRQVLIELGRQSIAGLQNAATSVSYDITVNDVIATFEEAYNNSSLQGSTVPMQEASMALTSLNSQFCPL